MAAGPLQGDWFPVTAGNCFAFAMAESAGGQIPALGVKASIAADSTWRGNFVLPDPLTFTTMTLRLYLRANAASGSIKVNPKWAVVGDGDNYSGQATTAEGTTTVTWSTGDAYELKIVDITLDAVSLTGAAGKLVKLALVFETSGWTLATTLWCKPVLLGN